MDRLTIAIAAIAIVVVTLALQPTPARAASCTYGAFNAANQLLYRPRPGIDWISSKRRAAKRRWACDRARRTCNRRLERAIRTSTVLPN